MGKQKQSGFTIVELLIVIVVIGILAALVLNSFSGAQTKAANTQTMEAVGAYVKGIKAYGIDKGAYPPAAGTLACIGSPFPGGICSSMTGAAPCRLGQAQSDPVFNTAMQQYMGQTLPLTSSQQMNCSGVAMGGAFYYIPNPNYVNIYVFLNNVNPCPSIGGVANNGQRQQGNYTMCIYLFPPL